MAYFLPIEIDGQTFQFRSHGVSQEDNSENLPTSFDKFVPLSTHHYHPGIEKRFLVYLPIHDLEAVWWVAVYFLVNRKVVKVGDSWLPKATSDTTRESRQKSYATQLFYNYHSRTRALTDPDEFIIRLQDLHPAVVDVGNTIIYARKKLVDAYFAAEKDLPSMEFSEVARGLHYHIQGAFYDIAKIVLSEEDVVVCRYDAENVGGTKRKHIESSSAAPSKSKKLSARS